MEKAGGEATRKNPLPDLDALDNESLKALVLAKQTEIENLNLLVLKLKRMRFGQRSEMNAEIGAGTGQRQNEDGRLWTCVRDDRPGGKRSGIGCLVR